MRLCPTGPSTRRDRPYPRPRTWGIRHLTPAHYSISQGFAVIMGLRPLLCLRSDLGVDTPVTCAKASQGLSLWAAYTSPQHQASADMISCPGQRHDPMVLALHSTTNVLSCSWDMQLENPSKASWAGQVEVRQKVDAISVHLMTLSCFLC